MLDDRDRLFLDIERNSKTEIDILELGSGELTPHLSHPAGAILILDARGDHQIVLRTDPNDPIGEVHTAIIRGDVVEPLSYPQAYRIPDGSRSWLGEGFGLVMEMLSSEYGSVVGRVDGSNNVFVRDGLIRVTTSGRWFAGRKVLFGETHIEVYEPGAIDPFSRLIANPPPSSVEIGPWMHEGTVLWIEGDAIYRFTIGDAEPTVLLKEPGCRVLDAKARTAAIGCGASSAEANALFTELRVFAQNRMITVDDVDGFVSEAAVLAEGVVAWREWSNRNVLCTGSPDPVGRIKVAEVLRETPAELVGESSAPCHCCARPWPPLRFEAESNSVAWNYDWRADLRNEDPPPIGASTRLCF